jgi:succinyl-CoA synthetase alpha subunit
MSILIDNTSKFLVQGITGQQGLFHTQRMLAYGTQIVAGVTPGKGGQSVLESNIPVFNTVHTAVQRTGANASIIFVPARFVLSTIIEAADAGIKLIICITEGVPVVDMLKAKSYIQMNEVTLIGPNCPGILSAGKSNAGIIPGHITRPGNIGVVSRSGTLTYEVLFALDQAGLGTSTCVGMGGDPIHGIGFIESLQLFENDPETEKIVMIGEIGGNDEENAADFYKKHLSKPVVGFIAGQSAPPGKRMGHAGAIIQGGSGKAENKIEAMQAAGIRVASTMSEIPSLLG